MSHAGGPAGRGLQILVPTSAAEAVSPAAAPCHRCTAKCCRYLALEIDPPITPEAHDQVRWYLVHLGTAVWVQDGAWYLEVRTVCRHLTAGNACAVYETRPEICREYGSPHAGDSCEYFETPADYELYFDSAEAFEAWSRPRLEKREKRLARRRELRRRRRTDTREEAIA